MLTILPILAQMATFYRLPRTPARFATYLDMLRGDTKDDLILPISGYNPMAKDHILEKLAELQALEAELIAEEAIQTLPSDLVVTAPDIQVVLNLADDLKGGWTDRYAMDFDSNFKINAIAERGFCTPFFWSSESYTEALIRERFLAAACRTLYWHQHGRLRTLADHVAQEFFVSKYARFTPLADYDPTEVELLTAHYDTHRSSDDYNLLFNFFYGDEASASLGYATYGVGELNGYGWVRSANSSILF